MHKHWEQGGRRGAISAAAVAVLLLVAGAVVIVIGVRGSTEPSPAASTMPSATSTQGDSASKPKKPRGVAARELPTPRSDFGLVLPGSSPVALTIPSIEVNANKIVDLGVAEDGSIEVPEDASAPGWFTPGPAPGQLGPAVIAGHVDSESGPAVFYRLGDLGQGDRVKVTRRDGSVATFAVDRVESYKKNAFPTRAVYGTTNRAELRLITCGGRYDSETGYLSNTVAFAHLVNA